MNYKAQKPSCLSASNSHRATLPQHKSCTNSTSKKWSKSTCHPAVMRSSTRSCASSKMMSSASYPCHAVRACLSTVMSSPTSTTSRTCCSIRCTSNPCSPTSKDASRSHTACASTNLLTTRRSANG